MPKFSNHQRGIVIASMGAASLATLGTSAYLNQSRKKLNAEFSVLANSLPEIKTPKRPKPGSRPPKWAITGPDNGLMTHSDLPECTKFEPDSYGAYTAPDKVRGYRPDKWNDMTEGLLLDSDYRIMYPTANPVEDSQYDLWIHFHRPDLFQKEWITEMRKTILVTLHLHGFSQVYIDALEQSYDWKQIRDRISQAVANHYNMGVIPRRIGLSGFSAGCAALQRIDSFEPGGVDAMICLDGFHGTYRGPDNEPITDYSRFRQAVDLPVNLPDYTLAAADGEKFLGISHSSIPCSGTCQSGHVSYASTTATARNMIWFVGGTADDLAYTEEDNPEDPYTVYNTYDQGNFHVIERRGADGPAHCRVFKDVPSFLKKAKKETGFQ
ncbi:hypothetical protein JXD20_02675 [Candidatus Peregrinibacteria bacterium]|nr:hypothetical protein [Candidatus Peregrinibacteria bacterium]